MVLNFIWIGLILIAVLVALVKMIFLGDMTVLPSMQEGLFESAKKGAEFCLGLIGTLAFGLGLLKIGEKSGLINSISKAISPFLEKIFPEIPKGSEVNGNIFMNFSANILGLDNAATPIGLKAMQGLQELNPNKEVASNAQIMFLTLNASGLTVIPLSIMAVRASAGAANPADIFIPILIATFCSTLTAFVSVSIIQKINLFQPKLFFPLLLATTLVGMMVLFFKNLNSEQINVYSSNASAIVLLMIVVFFIVSGMRKRINVFDSFIEGAKEGFESSIRIIPYLVAMLLAVGIFRKSGAMDMMMNGIGYVFDWFSWDRNILPALPTAFMKPLSGAGARGMLVDTMTTLGPDHFASRLASIFQGAADTTFIILTMYFGYVNVKNIRYALATCLIADLAGVLAGIGVAYIFFG